jgi:hypothetical protein
MRQNIFNWISFTYRNDLDKIRLQEMSGPTQDAYCAPPVSNAKVVARHLR